MTKQMSLKKKFTFILVVVIPVFMITAYSTLQIQDIAAYNDFCRNVVSATHLNSIRFLDVNSSTLQQGHFTVSFTFENPNDQTVNMTSMSAALFPTSPDIFPFSLGRGSTDEPIMLGHGETQIVLQMNLTENAPLTITTRSYWEINYKLKFGSIHYSYDSTTRPFENLPPLRTYGPYSAGEDTALTQVTTYLILTIDAWVIGFATITSFILIQERRTSKTLHKEVEADHSRIAAAIYALQGVTIIALPQLMLFIQNSVIHYVSPQFSYGGHGAAGVLVDMITAGVYIVGLILLAISLSLFLHVHAAKQTAYYISGFVGAIGLLVSVFLLANQLLLSSATPLNLTLNILALAIVSLNILVVYIFSPKRRQIYPAQKATQPA